VHARTDYAHAEAVRRILRAHVDLIEPRGGGLPHRGFPHWGRGTAVKGVEDNLRTPRPQIGGC
jgi:hypothetical protein